MAGEVRLQQWSQLRLLLLFLLLTSVWGQAGGASPEEELAEWIKQRGGTVGIRVGRERGACLRGALATRTYRAGEALMTLPLSACVALGVVDERGVKHEEPDKQLNELFRRWHEEPEFNATYAEYFATLPRQDELFFAEMFTDRHISMLQSPRLERLVREQRAYAWEVWAGRSAVSASVNSVLRPDNRITWDQYLYGAALMSTRHIWYEELDTGDSFVGGYFMPLLDMVNHADAPNAQIHTANRSFSLVALERIRRGEQVFINYRPDYMKHSDLSLLQYGFVAPKDEPHVAITDTAAAPRSLAELSLNLDDDSWEYHGGGKLCTRGELRRLVRLWAAPPTTEGQDLELLLGGTVADWREQAILRFRIQRKKAIRQKVAALWEALKEPAEESVQPLEADGFAGDEGRG